MDRRSISWRSVGFYLMGLVSIQMFIVARDIVSGDNFWIAVARSTPFYVWLLLLSVRLFGNPREDERS